ncbi:RNA polymerase sigma factor [Patescibacteria group bacterium]|nr:MAG: RNA polymerase sigma factor [Patescibacteria group bacterium]
MEIHEELALIARAKKGEQAALGLLWDAITPKLYGYLVNTLREKSLADDILQNTWLKAIASLAKFHARGVRFSSWLFAIARNECRQHWRQNGRERSIEETNEENFQTVSVGGDLSEKFLVEKILKMLPEEDRELLRLRYIADLPFKEIARVLEISVITARVRVHRSLARARTGFNTIV